MEYVNWDEKLLGSLKEIEWNTSFTWESNSVIFFITFEFCLGVSYNFENKKFENKTMQWKLEKFNVIRYFENINLA